MEAIQTVGLVKRYKDLTAVDGLDLGIGQGELFSLLGVNGAGKTTTIKMLSCLVKPTGGDAFLNGVSIVKEPSWAKEKIDVWGAWVFQRKDAQKNRRNFGTVWPWQCFKKEGGEAVGRLAAQIEHCHGPDRGTRNFVFG